MRARDRRLVLRRRNLCERARSQDSNLLSDPTPKRIASGNLKPGNLALMPTLMLSIGLLVLLSAGLIVAVNWVTGRAIVQEFATRLIARALSIQEMALRRHLDAAVDQATFIADAIRDGRYKLFDPALDDFISGTMAAAPQIGGLILADPSGKALRVVRGASNTTLQLDHFGHHRRSPAC